jgi:GntR family transcriptional repressor for pyruvate dehydrogenase complex
MAAVNRTDNDLIAMRRARTHFRLAYEMGAPVWEADIEFHQAITEASGNAVLTHILAPMSDVLRHARQATGTLPDAVELALRQHEEIATAIEDRSSRDARRAMTAHMQSAIWAIGQVAAAAAPPR